MMRDCSKITCVVAHENDARYDDIDLKTNNNDVFLMASGFYLLQKSYYNNFDQFSR